MRPLLIVTTGDPNGIGPEISLKALQDPRAQASCRGLLVGSVPILERAARLIGDRRPLRVHPAERPLGDETAEEGFDAFIHVATPAGVTFESPSPGEIRPEAGNLAYENLALAHSWLLSGRGDAMVTSPIQKQALHAAGRARVGHTEILADLSGVSDPITLFVAGDLWIAFFTRHLSLGDAIRAVKKEPLIAFVERLHAALKPLGRPMPRLAMAALNPHAGEGGLLGKEEEEEIRPAVEALRKSGILIDGPIGADSVFHLALEGHFDCVISLYHDQGHIAAKTSRFHETVSLTLGLPYIRTSVDHGTAFDIAWQGKARADSLVTALELAACLASHQNI